MKHYRMAPSSNLTKIINNCWGDFNAFHAGYKVNPSIPILWFGDMEAFSGSPKKIVTVALNPSQIEFQTKKNSAFSINARFPDYHGPFNLLNYYNALNDYFNRNPYRAWFSSLERVLNCLDASYFKENTAVHKENTAVHLDIYAPVATTPHWGKLSLSNRNQLVGIFGSYFGRMMAELKPDIILASLSKAEIQKHFQTSSGQPCDPSNASKSWCPPNKKGIFFRRYQLNNGEILITGRNMCGTAFGGLTPFELKTGISSIYP